MRKRILACILTVLMLSSTACVNININGIGGELAPDSPKVTTGGGNEVTNTDPEVNTPDTPAITENDADKITVGPEYVIPYYEQQYGSYGEDPGAKLIIHADQIKIITPGYDKLEESLEAMNSNVLMGSIESWDYDRFDSYGGSDDMYTGTEWNDTFYYTVERNDSQVFSVSCTEDSYLGGAHPFIETTTCNFETSSGRMLSLYDVVLNYDEIYNDVIAYLTKLTEENEDVFLYDGWEQMVYDRFYGGVDEFDGPNWYTKEDGIVIYFNGYEIAPWAAGEMDVTINMSDGKLNEAFFHTAGTVVDGAESENCEYSTIINDIYKPLSKQIGKWNYYECLDFFNKLGIDYEAEEPFASESDGEIRVKDSETGYTLRISFWPLDPSYENYGIEDEYIHNVEYVNDKLNWCCGDFYRTQDVSYYVIQYEIYMQLTFKSDEDFFKYMGKDIFSHN